MFLKVLEFGLEDINLRTRYDKLFESCADAFIQQSTYWAEVIKDLGPDKPIFLLCEDEGEDIAGLPLYLYEAPSGSILTSVAQPGPMGGVFYKEGLAETKIEAVYAVLLENAINIAIKNRCISLTIITNPFKPDLERYERHISPTFIFENFTQYIPVTEAVANGNVLHLCNSRQRNNLKRNLCKAKDAGFTVGKCESNSDFVTWYNIHCRRHTEIGAIPLEFKLLDNILKILGPKGKAHLFLAKSSDVIASGCLYIHHHNILDVFMLSMNTDYLDKSPNFLITEHSLLWAESIGVKYYNWQSSSKRDSGVYGYKKQWRSTESLYYFVTWLFCEPGKIEKMGISTIKTDYPWHYVVPFAVFEQGFDKRFFKKE